jgi:nucleotide-binding universal stress UspA family protein
MWSPVRRHSDGREVRDEEEVGAVEIPLVVGIDGSEASLEAVDWAADEAVRHEVPLHLVHAAVAMGLQLGLVNHAVLHHAPCPIAVVPQI